MRLFDPQGTKSEAEIQSEFLRRARDRGWVADKYENKSRKGGPDTLCSRSIRRRLIAVWIEFKRFGDEPKEQQLKRHEELRDIGWDVAWFDNLEDALTYLDSNTAI